MKKRKNTPDVMGKIFTTKSYGDVKVVEYINCNKIKVEFLNTKNTTYTTHHMLKQGYVKDVTVARLVCGVGINDARYKIYLYEKCDLTGEHKPIWACPYYVKWRSMLSRCYTKSYQENYPTYKGCTVCKEWLLFSNFKSWMEQQVWGGKHLDKDVLGGGKIYSPDTCCFLHPWVNTMLTESNTSRGELPIGVTIACGRYRASCGDPYVSTPRKNLGYYDNPEDAHNAWKHHKIYLINRYYEEGIIDREDVYVKLKEYYSKDLSCV